MDFNETYRDILNFVPDIPASDCMKLINNAISELNSYSFVQEWQMYFGVATWGTVKTIDLTDVDSNYNTIYDTSILKVKNVLDSRNRVLSKTGVGDEYINKIANTDEKVYGQIGDTLYVNESAGAESVVCVFDSTTDSIILDNGNDWSADYGFEVGDYIITSGNGFDSGNKKLFKISTIASNFASGDTITVDTDVNEVGTTESSTGDVSPAFLVIANVSIPQFAWNSGTPSRAIDVKEKFIPAIRFLVLSTIYDISKYGNENKDVANWFMKKADREIEILKGNEKYFKEVNEIQEEAE